MSIESITGTLKEFWIKLPSPGEFRGEGTWRKCTEEEYKSVGTMIPKEIRYAEKSSENLDPFSKIKTIAGHVSNDSHRTVTLSQDDATRTFHIRVDQYSFYGRSWEEAIDKAYEKYKEYE